MNTPFDDTYTSVVHISLDQGGTLFAGVDAAAAVYSAATFNDSTFEALVYVGTLAEVVPISLSQESPADGSGIKVGDGYSQHWRTDNYGTSWAVIT